MNRKDDDPMRRMLDRLEGIVARRHPITLSGLMRDLDLTSDEVWQAILAAPRVDVTWRRVSGRLTPYAVPANLEDSTP